MSVVNPFTHPELQPPFRLGFAIILGVIVSMAECVLLLAGIHPSTAFLIVGWLVAALGAGYWDWQLGPYRTYEHVAGLIVVLILAGALWFMTGELIEKPESVTQSWRRGLRTLLLANSCAAATAVAVIWFVRDLYERVRGTPRG